MRPRALKGLMMMMKGLNYFKQKSVADLGEGHSPPPPPFWVKKEKKTEEKKASRASKSRPPLITNINLNKKYATVIGRL